MFQNKRVSVVMPAYNEKEGISETIKGFKTHPFVDEVIVADNNSTDSTAHLAKEAGAKVVFEKRQGYGFACKTALAHATGDLIVLTESDNSFFPDDMELLFAYIPFFDIVKGARSNRNLISSDADWTFSLMIGNWLVAKYMQLLYLGIKSFEDMSMREVGGTFRVIKREALKKILPYTSEGQGAYLPDMVTIALQKKLKIIEIPVRYRGRLGVSKITGNRFRAFLLSIRMMLIITKNRFKKLA